MADGRIIIDTEVDSSGAEKDVKSLSSNLSNIAKTGLVAFTGAIATAGAAIGGLAGIATKYNSQMEDYFADFTVLLGSAEKATQHVEELKDFAAKTPFEMAGLADASKQLLSFGIGVEDIMPDLQMLGDISLGNQERFKGLALVFAQVASAGKLSGQDLLQFINQGFNPLQVIAEKTGKSMADLKQEMSDGKITYEMVAEAMKVATSEGGKFYQGMEVQSKTLSGMWSTLKDDTMSLIGNAFMPFTNVLKNNVMPALQGMVGQMTQAFADPNIQASIANIASGLGELAINIGNLISEYLPKIIEGFAWLLDNSNNIAAGIISVGTALMTLNVANMVMSLVKAFQLAKAAEEGLTVAQWLLNVAMSANPIGMVIAAIVGLIAGIIYLWNTNEGFRNALIGAWESIKNVGIATWEWLVKFFTVDIPNAFNFIINFFTDVIPDIINYIFNWFNELPYSIGYALGETIATVFKWGVDTGNYLKTNVPIWINNIITWFATLPSKIYSLLMNTISKVYQFGQNLGTQAKSAGSNMVNNIINAVSNLPSQMATVGMNIVKGVWNGITGMGSWISSKVSSFFTGIVDGAKAALGIHSPSRVFRDEVGKYMAKGVGVGFEDETDNVKKSMDDDFEALVAKMKGTVDYETSMTTARVVARNNALSGGSDESNSNSGKQVIENHIHVDIEGKEVAYAIAPHQDVLTDYYEGR